MDDSKFKLVPEEGSLALVLLSASVECTDMGGGEGTNENHAAHGVKSHFLIGN